MRNEDTRGDAAQLRLEIRRIKQQLQAWKDAALAAGVVPEGHAGPESGGSGEVRTASTSRGSSRRGSQRKGSVLNPAAWDELVSRPRRRLLLDEERSHRHVPPARRLSWRHRLVLRVMLSCCVPGVVRR